MDDVIWMGLNAIADDVFVLRCTCSKPLLLYLEPRTSAYAEISALSGLYLLGIIVFPRVYCRVSLLDSLYKLERERERERPAPTELIAVLPLPSSSLSQIHIFKINNSMLLFIIILLSVVNMLLDDCCFSCRAWYA